MINKAGLTIGQSDKELMFNKNNYIFPNNIEFCRQYKSFVTLLQINTKQFSEIQYKKLSIINKSRFIIKLKQIKKESSSFNNNLTQYKLYYEAIPFSLVFLKTSQHNFNIKNMKMQKILKEIVSDLIDFNIYCELNVQSCGFSQTGQFKIFIPPVNVISEKKLTSAQKIKLNTSCLTILNYWQKQQPKVDHHQFIKLTAHNDMEEYQEKIQNHEQDQNVLKKTIKLSKNMTKDNYKAEQKSSLNYSKKDNIAASKQYLNSNSININIRKSDNQIHNLKACKETTNIKITQQPSIKDLYKETPFVLQKINQQASYNQKNGLKKYKSMEQIVNLSSKDTKDVKQITYKSKIQQINEKLNNIKQTLNPKKIIGLQKTLNTQSKQIKNNNRYQNNEDNYEEEILFQNKNHRLVKQNQQYSQGQSFDTYLDQIGNQYQMPRFNSNNQLRKTTSPVQFLLIKNSLKPKENNNDNWKHTSAGNKAFKSIIKKNQELYPQIMQQNYSIRSKDKTNGASSSMKKDVGSKILKKMISLDTFDNKMETKSIHKSQFSKDLASNKRKKEKQQKNIQLKEKVQDILLKSKKAIQLLKSPPIKPKTNSKQ